MEIMLKKLERYMIKIYLYLINLEVSEVSMTISTDSLLTTYRQITKSVDMLLTVKKTVG